MSSIALPLYDDWSRPRIVAAIDGILEGLSTTAAMISYPNGMSIQRVSRAEAMQTLRLLYARRAVLDGTVPVGPNTGGMRFVRARPRRAL